MTQMTFGDVLSCISEDEISWVLRRGSGFENGRSRIYDFFAKTDSIKERAEFLKKEYGTGGMAPIFWEHIPSGVNYDTKGLEIYKYDETRKFTWIEVAERISELINGNNYKGWDDE